MKRLLIVLTAVLLTATASAQLNKGQEKKVTSVAENKDIKIEYLQWTAYSSYAGYYIAVTNKTNDQITITIQMPSLDVYEENIILQPGDYQVFQLGYQDPFVANTPIIVTSTSYKHNFSLVVVTGPTQ